MPYCNLNGLLHNKFVLKDRASNTLAVSASGGEEKYPYCFRESKSYFTDTANVCGLCRPFPLNEKCIYVLRYLKVFSSHSCFTKKLPTTREILTFIVLDIFGYSIVS
jgi:hypothetical protein